MSIRLKSSEGIIMHFLIALKTTNYVGTLVKENQFYRCVNYKVRGQNKAIVSSYIQSLSFEACLTSMLCWIYRLERQVNKSLRRGIPVYRYKANLQ